MKHCKPSSPPPPYIHVLGTEPAHSEQTEVWSQSAPVPSSAAAEGETPPAGEPLCHAPKTESTHRRLRDHNA